MDEDAPHMGMPRERLQRSSRSCDRHVAHAPAGLVAEAIGDHFVVGEQRAVEKQHVRFADAGVEIFRNMGAAGRIDEPRAPRLRRDADRAFADLVEC